MKEEVMNWDRRPHDLWWFQTIGWMLSYFILINAGFLLLFGYARRAGSVPKPGNGIWITSAIYNVIMAGLNGAYVHGQAPKAPLTYLLDPTKTAFWMIAIPLLGAFYPCSVWATRTTYAPRTADRLHRHAGALGLAALLLALALAFEFAR